MINSNYYIIIAIVIEILLIVYAFKNPLKCNQVSCVDFYYYNYLTNDVVPQLKSPHLIRTIDTYAYYVKNSSVKSTIQSITVYISSPPLLPLNQIMLQLPNGSTIRYDTAGSSVSELNIKPGEGFVINMWYALPDTIFDITNVVWN